MTGSGATKGSDRAPVVALFLLFGGVTGLLLWQATRHVSPTIFTDEIQMTQMARSIAETGHSSLRGQPNGIAPLAAYLSAPFWWVDDVPTAYSLVKAMGSIVMALVVFPAYALARLAVRPWWALFAAAGAALSPALAYAPILVKEPTAYPIATLALFLIARFVAKPTWIGLGLAFACSLLGIWSKGQLAVLLAVLVVCSGAVIWGGERFSRFRRTWSTADWVGFLTLGVGVLIVANVGITHRSQAWYTSTTFFQDRMLELGFFAAGALTIGLGLVPLIAGLASLVPPRGEVPTPGVRALRIVTISAIVIFGFYTAVKAAFLSTVYANLTLERNLIFIGPLLYAGTALFLQRRGGRWWAVVAAGCLGLYLVWTTPYSLTAYPNYEAHGLAMAAFANRIFRWPLETIQHALVAVTIVSTLVLALLPRLRGRQVALVAAGMVAVLALFWSGTGQVYAAHGEALFSERLYGSLTKPANWVDRTTGGRSVTLLGQGIRDPNPINLLEFWNRTVTSMWSLDGTAPPPGATLTPDLLAPDGTITKPSTDFVLVTPGVNVNGNRIGPPIGGYSLYRASNGLRLANALRGVEPDGWMSKYATFTRHDVPAGVPGHLRVTLSRENWCGKDVRSNVTIRLGPVAVSESNQPEIRPVQQTVYGVLHSCQKRSYTLRTPPVPWRVEVTVTPTFSPARLDPTQDDQRELGAVPIFSFSDDR